MAAVLGPGCTEAYQAVFRDDSPDTWCWLGYEGNKLTSKGRGNSGVNDMVKQCTEDTILYGFLRLNKTDDGGDSKRVKFVFLTWVGERASPLKKGKVSVHKEICANLFKGFHIEKQLYELEALEKLEQEIDDSLKKAGGANYDLGNTRTGVQAGASRALKSSSALFFQKKEQETEIQRPVYYKGPLSKGITHCDLGGRQFVAKATDAKKNTVGYD